MNLEEYYQKIFDEMQKTEGKIDFTLDFAKLYEDAKKLGYDKSREEFEDESKTIAKKFVEKVDPAVLKGLLERIDGSKISDSVLEAAAGGGDISDFGLVALCG